MVLFLGNVEYELILWFCTHDFRIACMFLSSHLFLHTFPISSSKMNKMFGDVFNGFNVIVRQIISIPSYILLRFVALSYMRYNTIGCILLIKYTAVGALSRYLFVSTFFRLDYTTVECGRWGFSWRGRCAYIENEGNGTFDALFVDGHCIGLNVDDAKRSHSAKQEHVVCSSGRKARVHLDL